MKYDLCTDEHVFKVRIKANSAIKVRRLLSTLRRHLDDFGEGEFWDADQDKPTVRNPTVEVIS